MKEITLYREDNGQYSTSEARQNDVSGVYVQKEHLTDLQAQNDELMANNSKLRESLRDACMYLACTVDISKYSEALESIPAQSLADIRTEAVMSLIDSGLGFASEFESEWLYREEDIKDYANKIKGCEL